MKTVGKKIGALLFITIYCFAIGRVGTSNVSYVSEKGKHAFSLSTDLFAGFVFSDESFSSSLNLPNPNIKDNFSGPGILENAFNLVFRSKYTQYVSFTKNLLIRHRKADLIFPFHYFW